MGGTVDLSYVAIETLPNEVGSLIHLRYLDLSKTKLVELPESVCNLRNLQTLKLTSCEKLRRLPEGLRKLVNLRHLELLYTDALECLPKGIEELRCLQTLSKFVMSEEGCQLRELSNLNNLSGYLRITNIRGGGSKESINLKSKEHIRTLGLGFVKEDYVGKRDDDGSAIELFEPHPNLEELAVWYYGGSKFPNWMEFQSSSIMLRRLRIVKCRNLEVLPSWAKLESLQSLVLQELDSMSPMGLFNGLEASSTTVAYPNLKVLVIWDMKHWEEWVMETSSEDINVMPLLRDLFILNCPVLKSVPHQILSQSVKILFIRDCPELIISWLPPLLEELTLDGDAGSLSRSLHFKNNTSLKVMWIQNLPHLTFPQGLSQLKALQTLKIVDCNSLTCIPHELQHLTSLRELVISGCPILGPRCEKDEGWIRLLICCAIKVGDGIGIISRIPNFEITVRQGYNEGQLHTKIHRPLYFVRTLLTLIALTSACHTYSKRCWCFDMRLLMELSYELEEINVFTEAGKPDRTW
ncbi:hypothetical protein GIB67_024069 [Kingdonia uniflora]|uniref:R13L1/DRL21-like LRR repeat region domain-containing protein n=1 Tax=Kingdonia uniflora TaxID=39325 RepID=A0A7J7LV56_9MAGN|nr:hypothetical protein GIB67_024069 [Kingdonia uniflora]